MSTDDKDQQTEQQIHELYRSLPQQQPPAELDEKILAAAHAAVRHSSEPAGEAMPKPAKRSWYIPLSMAAVVLVSFSLVVKLVVDEQVLSPDEQLSPTMALPAPEVEQPAPEQETVAPPAPSLAVPAFERAPVQTFQATKRSPPVPETKAIQEQRNSLERRASEQRMMMPQAPEAAAGLTYDRVEMASDVEQQALPAGNDAEARIQVLLQLLEAGEEENLRQQLAAFVRVYPEHPLPDVLLEWQSRHGGGGED